MRSGRTKLSHPETSHIYVMDADSVNSRWLIEGAGDERGPDWSRQTGEIVASVWVNDRWELWFVEPESGDVIATLRFHVDAQEQCWQR